MRHPNTMTENERAEYRDARAGFTGDGQIERHLIAGGGCYYLSEQAGRFVVLAYEGKALRPTFHESFRTAEGRATRVAGWAERLRSRAVDRENLRAERKKDTHSLNVGAVLTHSWGYEQTNVDWYQVIAVVSDKTVVIRKIAPRVIDGEGLGSMAGHSTPHLHQFIGEPMRVRAGARGVSMRFGTAAPWDGMPRYCSWYA